MTVQVAVVGGTGYGGLELIRLLHMHPYVELTSVISHSESGEDLHHIYPHTKNVVEVNLDEWNIEETLEEVDYVFFSLPSGISQKYVAQARELGKNCIDLSGDFRLKQAQLYEDWYKNTPANEKDLEEAVYGLPEKNRANIEKSSLVANPGCYPTAALLGLLPMAEIEGVDPSSVIIDGKTGVSGAGKSLTLATHFTESNENVKPYKVGKHQHIPEIEQLLEEQFAKEVNITFTPHLTPMTRGILCTMYVQLHNEVTAEELIDHYRSFYESDSFVRVRDAGSVPGTKDVYSSNFCDIAIDVDSRTNRVTIVSAIDNLVKGASGQAIQNLNIMNGWDERTGLWTLPMYP
ncbi:N-acetyl-gamma-glutamyl-phosphate reductase [Texcoconibacillus texcoconensis]|uniref:N-acetyl-gamma-glutamyl-phosphate reductase n=1 Tax=Texcoconibacillus texcoconensis TaxID=1095777 RepID=A0A840QRR5_9BACI|nr:N-acetyl-gamma-glutamyl-phosphate reductase [Texcoconibacillus texcoconensis]MBB5174176.1 N-acetyl-gamma-glutamyl-phosphate reductase [Texcoconibacillus texcoconensis]